MAESNIPVSAPNSVNYGDQLPLGIESKSQRRLFFPSTGDAYSGDGNNICRIDISYDGMVDFANSYLSFEVANNTGHEYQMDMGQPLIQRLRIECGGVVLEDIQNYNHLVAGILAPCQNGVSNNHWETFNCTQPSGIKVKTAQMTAGGVTNAQANILLQSQAGATGAFGTVVRPKCGLLSAATQNCPYFQVRNGAVRQCCYKLVSGLLDNDKYIPTVLLNAPITLEITFANRIESGCGARADNGAAEVFTGNIDIKKVRYVAHTIDLERSFYNRLRMVQQSSGGVLQIAGTSFRNYVSSLPQVINQSIAIPARLRSIKSVFWKVAGANTQNVFGLSAGGHANITGYQIKIGGNVYPPTKIETNFATNKLIPYIEVQKAFGKLGSTVHSDMLTPDNYLVDVNGITAFSQNDDEVNTSQTVAAFAPYGIDLESFRHEIENGVDTASKALPMTLELDQSAALGADTPIQIFVMYDSLFYINMDGTISVST